MAKTPVSRPEHVDDLIAESRRLQELLRSTAADVDAWAQVLRAALADDDTEPIDDA